MFWSFLPDSGGGRLILSRSSRIRKNVPESARFRPESTKKILKFRAFTTLGLRARAKIENAQGNPSWDRCLVGHLAMLGPTLGEAWSATGSVTGSDTFVHAWPKWEPLGRTLGPFDAVESRFQTARGRRAQAISVPFCIEEHCRPSSLTIGVSFMAIQLRCGSTKNDFVDIFYFILLVSSSPVQRVHYFKWRFETQAFDENCVVAWKCRANSRASSPSA